MNFLTCVEGTKTVINDGCPDGFRSELVQGVLLSDAQFQSLMASAGPVDVGLMAQVFFFFFSSSLLLWLVGKVLGTVIKFMREA